MGTRIESLRVRGIAGVGMSALLLVGAVACGSDGGGGTTSSGGTTPVADGGTGGFQLAEPAKLVALVEVEGESPQAVSDPYNGFQMAIDDINAAGGIGGHAVASQRISATVSAAGFTTAVQKADEAGATAAIGLISTTYTRAALPTIAEAEMPLLSIAPGNMNADEVAQADGWVFQPNVSDSSGAMTDAAAEYAVETLGAKKIGLMHADANFGKAGTASIKAKVEELGAEVIAQRSYAYDATDLTEEVLAMKGADVIINWAYPGPLAVQLKTAAQNGLDIPTIDSVSAALVVSNELVDEKTLSSLYGSSYCNPTRVADWAQRYEARFGTTPPEVAAAVYDDTMLAAAAIRLAQSTDAGAVKEALKAVTYDEGVCAPHYQLFGDANQMSRSATVMKWVGGRPETVLQVDE